MIYAWILIVMNILMAVPFLTLLERKVLGYIQSRKGPKKVSYLGLLQPVSDGVKLMLKNMGILKLSNMVVFWIAPILSFLLMILAWSIFPSFYSYYSLTLSGLFFLCMTSLQVYTLLGAGWSSNSKYALLGSLRGVAQTMSYEVSLIFMLFFPCSLEHSYKWLLFQDKTYVYLLMMFHMFFMWLMSCLAETNRAPFDFAEGESELVSGFNIEFSALGFTFLFLSEYGNMLLMSFLSALLFMPYNFFFKVIMGSLMAFWFVWVRGSLPRFRYDFLMDLCWKSFLVTSLLSFFILLL